MCRPSWKAEEDTKPPPVPQLLTAGETQHPAFSSPAATGCRPALLTAFILESLPELGTAETAAQQGEREVLRFGQLRLIQLLPTSLGLR